MYLLPAIESEFLSYLKNLFLDVIYSPTGKKIVRVNEFITTANPRNTQINTFSGNRIKYKCVFSGTSLNFALRQVAFEIGKLELCELRLIIGRIEILRLMSILTLCYIYQMNSKKIKPNCELLCLLKIPVSGPV